MARFHHAVGVLGDPPMRPGEVFPPDSRPVQLVPRLESTPSGRTLVLQHPVSGRDVLWVALTDLDVGVLAMQFLGEVAE